MSTDRQIWYNAVALDPANGHIIKDMVQASRSAGTFSGMPVYYELDVNGIVKRDADGNPIKTTTPQPNEQPKAWF